MMTDTEVFPAWFVVLMAIGLSAGMVGVALDIRAKREQQKTVEWIESDCSECGGTGAVCYAKDHEFVRLGLSEANTEHECSICMGSGRVMRIEELERICRQKIADGDEAIILVTRSTRLCGRRGPIGELLSENSNGEKVVRFKAAAVLKFIERERG